MPAPKDLTEPDNLVLKYGFGRPDSHNIYFNALKEHAIWAWNRYKKQMGVKPADIILASGVRKFESKRRFKNTREVGHLGGHWIIAPIYNWTTARVWDYIRTNKIEIFPSLMGMSEDCFCGSFASRGERRLMKKLYPFLDLRIQALEKEVGGVWGNKNLPRHCISGNMCILEAIKPA